MKIFGLLAVIGAVVTMTYGSPDPEPPIGDLTVPAESHGYGAPPVAAYGAPAYGPPAPAYGAPAHGGHGWGAPVEHVTLYGHNTKSHGPTHVRQYHKHSYITKPSHSVEHFNHHAQKHKTVVHQHHHHEKVLHQHHHHQHVLHQHHLHKVHLHNLHVQKQHLHNHHTHKLHVHQPVYHTHHQKAHQVTEEHKHKQTHGEVHKHQHQHHEKHTHAAPIHHAGWQPAHGYGH